MEFGISGRTAFIVRESTLWAGIILSYVFFKTNSLIWFIIFVLDIAIHFGLSFVDYCTIAVYMSDELKKQFKESPYSNSESTCYYKSTHGLKSCTDCKMYGDDCDGDEEMCEDDDK